MQSEFNLFHYHFKLEALVTFFWKSLHTSS
jgi:hypothetical protein